MKKRFWTRLVSAVLTMAMAFSILAVPASAASTGSSWAIGMVYEENGTEVEMWITEFALQTLAESSPDMVDLIKAALEEEGMTEEYATPENIPNEACVGIGWPDQEVTYWYGQELFDKIMVGGEEAVAPTFEANGTISFPGEEPIEPIAKTSNTGSNPVDPDPSKPVVKYTAAVGQLAEGTEAEGMVGDSIVWRPVVKLTDAEIKEIEESGKFVRTGLDIASNRVDFGVSSTEDGNISWYTWSMLEQLEEAMQEQLGADVTIVKGTFDADSEKLILTLSDNSVARVTPLYITSPDGTTSTPSKPSTPSSSSSSSSSDNTVAIIAVVGAAVAAATGVYFYTHPEKWQEIKDYFADLSANVQAKFQEFTDGVKGALGIPTEEKETAETVEAAENTAALQDAAA